MSNHSYEGVFDFYKGRIESAPNYGFTSGHEILRFILRTAFNDSLLTLEEFDSIINLCEQAHIKMMEENYNAGWNEQNS